MKRCPDHGGEKVLIADDVDYTYNALLDKANAYPLRGNLEGVTAVRATDKATVQITTDGPTPDLLAKLADFHMMIMAKHVKDQGQDLDKVSRDTERDYFMSAEEATDYNLIDRVISKH